jgi:glutaredoxin
MKLSDIESIEIYSINNCPFCVKAKSLLSEHNIDYDEYIVGRDVTKQDIQSRVDAMGMSVQIRTVPQIFAEVNDDWVYIGGYSELSNLPK